MSKDEIIQLAKEKGFTSKALCNTPYKHSSQEELRWLFWLTELQKWFRNTQKINIEVTRFPNIQKWGTVVTDMTIMPKELSLRENINLSLKVVIPDKFENHEEALVEGILKALKEINLKRVNTIHHLGFNTEQKEFICSIINQFGDGQHPYADLTTFDGFSISYVKEILSKKKFNTAKKGFTKLALDLMKEIESKL